MFMVRDGVFQYIQCCDKYCPTLCVLPWSKQQSELWLNLAHKQWDLILDLRSWDTTFISSSYRLSGLYLYNKTRPRQRNTNDCNILLLRADTIQTIKSFGLVFSTIRYQIPDIRGQKTWIRSGLVEGENTETCWARSLGWLTSTSGPTWVRWESWVCPLVWGPAWRGWVWELNSVNLVEEQLSAWLALASISSLLPVSVITIWSSLSIRNTTTTTATVRASSWEPLLPYQHRLQLSAVCCMAEDSQHNICIPTSLSDLELEYLIITASNIHLLLIRL